MTFFLVSQGSGSKTLEMLLHSRPKRWGSEGSIIFIFLAKVTLAWKDLVGVRAMRTAHRHEFDEELIPVS